MELLDKFLVELLVLFLVSLAICLGLVLSKDRHVHKSGRGHAGTAVQSAHSSPTPRIGGLAVVVAVAVGFLFVSPNTNGLNLSLLCVSLLPVFVAGFAEDLGYSVAPKWRVVAAMVSSLIAALTLGAWLQRVGVPGFDSLLAFAPIGIFFTMFATAGISNAFNLIDGLNGLSGAIGVVVATCLAIIASQAGVPEVAIAALITIPAILGFLAFNFPFGKIFLGDAGAYSLGHILAWVSVVLIARADAVSPWAVVLVFFWPIADTLLAIYRRLSTGKRTDQPDRLHFHQMAMRGIETLCSRRLSRNISNPIATVVLLPFVLVPAAMGVFFWDNSSAAVLALADSAVSFYVTFRLVALVAGSSSEPETAANVVGDSLAGSDIRIQSPQFTYSDLSGIYSQNGLLCDVRIYQTSFSIGWFLEAIEESGRRVVWPKRFHSDKLAWSEFQKAVNGDLRPVPN